MTSVPLPPSTRTKALRGFACMSLEKRTAIAAKGGAATPSHKRSFAQNRDLAASAGSKGGNSRAANVRAARKPLP